MKRRLLLSLALLVISAGLCRAAFADSITITLDNPNQTATVGQTIGYSGTITNNSITDEFYIVTDQAEILPLSTDDTPFLSAPTTLDPGQSYSGLFFYVSVPSNTPFSPYVGTFTVKGNADNSENTNIVGVADFSTTVVPAIAPTPEPSSWLLMGTGICGIVTIARSKRNRVVALTKIS